MAITRSHKVVEKCQIHPATTTSLPLSFLDLPLAGPIYVRRQFFYQFPHSTHHFYQNTLPILKRSLSLTLQLFPPLAGNLLSPPPPHKPFIRCTAHDSITLTVLESAANFNHLSSNHPKTLIDLDHLVPKLTFTTIHHDDNDNHDDNVFMFPLMALQATVFPNHGLCIAITYCHVMDDNCCGQFMKSWSSISQLDGVQSTSLNKSLTLPSPCFDREVLKDTKGLEAIFLRDYFIERSTWKNRLINTSQIPNHEDYYLKATIVFTRDHIQGLKKSVLNQWNDGQIKNQELNRNYVFIPQYLSKFVVTCGFVWASLVKTRCRNDVVEEENKEEYFRFAGDCRDRLEYSVPETYFGNCLTLCHATLTRKDLKGEDGFVNAVKVIERAVTEMKKEPLKDAENWKELFTKMFVFGSTLLVTGSPKFTVYETDFGFGRAKKVEMVHSLKGMSLAESGDGEGGLEVGLVFTSNDEFQYFVSLIEQGIEGFRS